jgi:hypothetical protein
LPSLSLTPCPADIAIKRKIPGNGSRIKWVREKIGRDLNGRAIPPKPDSPFKDSTNLLADDLL